jgi:ATP-binding cassette subfamily B (MDR/TAP) protein 1
MKVFDLDIQGDALDHFEDDKISYRVRRTNIFMLLEKSDLALLFFGGFATIAGALGPAISSILMGRVFNTLSKFLQGHYDSFGEYMQAIRLSTMALLALGAGSVFVIWATITAWMQIGEIQAVRARKLMLKTYLKKPISWYEENDKVIGDLTQTNRCVEELRAGTAEASALVLQSSVAICALLGTSFYYSWSVTLIMLCSAPPIIVLAFIFAKLIEKYTQRENTESTASAKILDWSLVSAKLVRLFSTQDVEYITFSKALERCKNAFINVSLVSSANLASLRFIILCMFVQGFWFGSSQVRKNKVDAGDVLTCFTSCLMVGETLRSALPQIVTIQKANVAIKKIQGFVQLRETKIVRNKFKEEFNMEDSKNISLYPATCTGDIKFKNVDFAYPTRHEIKVLRNVDIHFRAGELCFLVGRSGSGKSTLSSLLLNFYTPDKGRIEIDGFNVTSLNERWLTDNVALVEQTCTLFDDTLKNNIIMGRFAGGPDNVSDQELQEAVRMALLEEVVRDLEDGLETVVGSTGISLSGGQQQRVAIARARLRDTPVLILDESVSALDIVMRDLMIEAIKRWRKGKTTIILTHEFTQIGPNDYVYLMENGVVVEHGFRSELKKDGLFNHLVSLQSGSYDESADEFESPFENVLEEESDLLNTIGKRLSTQLLSTVNPLSHFQQQDLQFEIDSRMLQQKPRARRLKRMAPEEKDIQKGIKDSDKRPDLTPITNIVIRMIQTVEKKSILLVGILFSILNGAVGPVFSYAFSRLLSGIVPQGSDVGTPRYLLKWSLVVLSLALFDGVTLFLKEFILNYSAELWIFGLRKRAFQKISQQSLKWFSAETSSAAEVNALLMNDTRDLRSLISHFLGVITTVIVLATMGLIWALVEGWKLSLLFIGMLPAFVITSGLYAGLLQNSENEYKNAVASLETQLYEVVKGFKTIRTLRLEGYFEEKFEERVHELQLVAKKRALFTGMGVAVTNMLTFIVQGVLLFYGMRLVGKGEYTVMQLMETFVLLVFCIMNCVQLMNQIPDISRGQRAGTYIFGIVNLEADTLETKGLLVPKKSSRILMDFKNVNFNYPSAPKQQVLKNVSFQIAQGERVAVIGESGSGKSTLTLLISRLYESQGVFFQCADINDLNLKWLRSQIAIVDQKAQFFDGTIRRNITYGLVDATEKDIIESLKQANIYDFVLSLPEGLDTRIDTTLMSGGQAQRLSIARALIRRPKLLILDECTSALDAEGTSKIAQLVTENLRGTGIAVMMITHSVEMMEAAERVIVMKNGNVCEQGVFNELYGQNGEFFRIVTAGRY